MRNTKGSKNAVRTLVVLLAFVSLWSPVRLEGVDLPLIQNGKSDYVIVTPKSPSPSEQLAAQELGKYLERIGEAIIPIRQGGPIPRRALVVAERQNLKPLALDAPKELSEEAYAIIPRGARILLLGGRGRSTLYAVYAFLDRLGCRWLSPDLPHYQGGARVLPKKSAVSYPSTDRVISKPALPLRKLDVGEGRSHSVETLLPIIDWMAQVGLNTLVVPLNLQGKGQVMWERWREKLAPELERRDILLEVRAEGYQEFINAQADDGRIFGKQREWFALDGDGKRTQEPDYVFCTSNQEAVTYLISTFISYITIRPEINIFTVRISEDARWCACEKCGQLGGAVDRQIILSNQLKSEVSRSRPHLRVGLLACAASPIPSGAARLHPEAVLDFCPSRQSFAVQIHDATSETNAGSVRALKNWRERFTGDIGIHSFYRNYAWDSLPVILARYMQDDLQFYRSIPIQGISTIAEPGDWFTYEINHYALARLAWDPAADVRVLMQKFCEARYGSAAGTAVRALEALEEIVPRYGGIPETSLETVEELSRAEARLAGISDSVRNAFLQVDETRRRQFSRLLLLLHYARLDLALQKARLGNEDRRKAVSELYSFLAARAEDGVFLGDRLSLSHLFLRYGIQ